MAFTIPNLRPQLINTNFGQSISALGDIISQSIDERAARDVFANLQSDDPESFDQAMRRLSGINKEYADLAQRMRTQREAARDREEAREISRGQLGVSRGNLSLSQQRFKAAQDALTQEQANQAAARDLLKGMTGGAGEAAPTVAPTVAPTTPAVVPPYPGTEPDEDEAPGPGAALGPEEVGIDISAAQKLQQQPGGITGLSKEQLLTIFSTPGMSPEIREMAKLRLQELAAGAKEKAPEDEFAKSFSRERGQEFQKELGTLYKQGRDAVNEQSNLERQRAILQSGKFPTGRFSPGMTELHKTDVGLADQLESFGIPIGKIPGVGGLIQASRERVSAAEQFEAVKAEGLYNKLGGFSKGITDEDRKATEKMYASVKNTTEGNLALIEYHLHMKRLEQKEAKEVQNYMRYQAANKQPVDPEAVARLRERIRKQGGQELLEHAKQDAIKLGARVPWADQKGAPAAGPTAAPTTGGGAPQRPTGSPQPNQIIEHGGKRWQFIGGDPANKANWREII